MFIAIAPSGFSFNSLMQYHNTMYALLPNTCTFKLIDSVDMDEEVGLEIQVRRTQ